MMLWSIDRDGNTVGMVNAVQATYAIDAISAEKSTFELMEDASIFKKGNFVLYKPSDDNMMDYFGVIDSYEDKKLVCNDIIVLANFEIPTAKISGPSFEQHYLDLLNKYLFNDPTKGLTNIRVEIRTNTSHLYQPAESPSSTNLMKYLINAFKKYNIVWGFDRFENGIVYTYLEAVTNTFQIKNNVHDFREWSISTTEVGKDVENMLLIIDKKASTNMMAPKVLATYYLTNENEVTTNANDEKIILPTRNKVHIFDPEQTDPPTYEEIAKSELKGSYYSHEITVDTRLQNRIIAFKNLRIGLLATIYYNDVIYKSVLSGYSYTDGSDVVSLTFGNIRSRISELLE